MATTIRANTFLQRLIGAAALDAAIYEEVEADPNATGQAMLVVVGSSIAMGIGAQGLGGGPGTIAVFGVMALVTWAAWALLWALFWLLLARGRDIGRFTGAMCIAQGVLTGWLPGYLLLSGRLY